MPSLNIQSFPEALKSFMARTTLASPMTAAEWDAVEPQIRQRSFWSAQQTDADMLDSMKAKIEEAMRVESDPKKATMDRSKFVADMRNELGADEGDSGKLTDITSRRRLELIYDHNIEAANEFGRAKVGNSPAILRTFPCQELIRVESRENPRDWQSRWTEAGGTIYSGRMIARKDDPIWTAINRFGVPYPPFDYSSGMGVRDVGRSESIRLGVITREDAVQPVDLSFAIEEGAA